MKKIITIIIFNLIFLTIIICPFSTKAENAADACDYLKTNYISQANSNKDWAAIALGANNQKVGVVVSQSDNVLDISRNALALTAQGINNQENIEKIKKTYLNSSLGSPDLVNDDIFGTLAILTQNDGWLDSRQEIFNKIISTQRTDGSFGYSINGSADVDMTSAAIWALKYKKEYQKLTIDKAFEYLDKAQNTDGGFGFQAGKPSNIASTSWAAMAYAAGERENSKVFNFILNQKQTGGFWLYDGKPSYMSSAYAVLALSKKALPIIQKSPVTPQNPSDNTQPPQSNSSNIKKDNVNVSANSNVNTSVITTDYEIYEIETEQFQCQESSSNNISNCSASASSSTSTSSGLGFTTSSASSSSSVSCN